MTTIDSDGWPNWATHTYYGPGIDAPQNTNTTTDSTVHGLLSAPPKTDISTAMAIEHRRAEQYHSRSKMTSHISVSLRTQTEQSP